MLIFCWWRLNQKYNTISQTRVLQLSLSNDFNYFVETLADLTLVVIL